MNDYIIHGYMPMYGLTKRRTLCPTDGHCVICTRKCGIPCE